MKEKIKPIYEGKREDFTWVGFGSGSGTNLEACAKIIPPAIIFSDRPSAKLFDLPSLKTTKFMANVSEFMLVLSSGAP